MSRSADAFGAFYRQSRGRLLHQVYAYVGNPEVAQRALADAYISAGQHWRKLAKSPDQDAWMREKAFAATRRAQNRARRPWFENAKQTAEPNRVLLSALTGLDPQDRHLVIAHFIAGKDLFSAAREVGLTDSAAQLSLDKSLTSMAETGIDTTRPAAVSDALLALRHDLVDEPAERAGRLRREGNRRRRSHMVLTGLTVIALAIGAGAVTAAQNSAADRREISRGTNPDLTIADPDAPPTESFTVDSLATAQQVRVLGRERRWDVTTTSADFGDPSPIDACLQLTPSEQRNAHYWVRTFTGGQGKNATEVVQSLQVARSPDAATKAYAAIVSALSTCRGGEVARRLGEFQSVSGVGDSGSQLDYTYSLAAGLQHQHIAVTQTGLAVIVWVVRDTEAVPVQPKKLLKLTATTVDELCVDAEGTCTKTPVAREQIPPVPDNRAAGFVGDVDLPLFDGMTDPWVSTSPMSAAPNPASTQCDDADFAESDANARNFVIPGAKGLPDIFGMSQTVGTFASAKAARQFTSALGRRVDKCEDRQLNMSVGQPTEIEGGGAHGTIWPIEQATNENQTQLYRMAVVRVGARVTQLTFTPSDEYDVTPESYMELCLRAADRLRQRG